MSPSKTLPRLALATLAAACIAVPTASAQPIHPVGPAAPSPQQQDMHASTVHKPDPGIGSQDVRGESAAGRSVTAISVQDARGESAAGGGTSGGKPAEPQFQGPPTWPVHPTPIPAPATTQAPVATDGGDDIGVDLPVALLILAGTLALGGGMAAAAMKVRDHTHTAH